VATMLKFSPFFFFFHGGGDQAQDLLHAGEELSCWAAPLTLLYFIYQSVNKHLGCSQFLTIINLLL
jgi:hypothetical protein